MSVKKYDKRISHDQYSIYTYIYTLPFLVNHLPRIASLTESVYSTYEVDWSYQLRDILIQQNEEVFHNTWQLIKKIHQQAYNDSILLHWDLHGKNILVDWEKEVYLIDFEPVDHTREVYSTPMFEIKYFIFHMLWFPPVSYFFLPKKLYTFYTSQIPITNIKAFLKWYGKEVFPYSTHDIQQQIMFHKRISYVWVGKGKKILKQVYLSLIFFLWKIYRFPYKLS